MDFFGKNVPPSIFIARRNNSFVQNFHKGFIVISLGGKNYFLVPPGFFIAPRNNELRVYGLKCAVDRPNGPADDRQQLIGPKSP
jgi:hypothetical protein